MGILMFFVAIVYAVLQLGINGIIIYKATNGSLSLYFVLGFLLMVFVYLGIRAVIMRQCVLKVGKDYLFYVRFTCIDINFKKWLRTKFDFDSTWMEMSKSIFKKL
jgi:hypothetical protein